MGSQNIQNNINSYIEKDLPGILEKSNIPAAAIVVVKDGEVIYNENEGYSDIPHY